MEQCNSVDRPQLENSEKNIADSNGIKIAAGEQGDGGLGWEWSVGEGGKRGSFVGLCPYRRTVGRVRGRSVLHVATELPQAKSCKL